MKIDVRPANSGKTINLIKKSAEMDIPIVCPVHSDAIRISNLAYSLGVNIPRPVVFNHNMRGLIKDNVCLVDDLDRILAMVIPATILGATITKCNDE